MTQILFLPNERVLVWLPVEVGAAVLARMVRERRWTLPPALAERFGAPEGLELHARVCGEVLVVWPHQPLREIDTAEPVMELPDLEDDQRAVLRLLAEGRATKQVALALGRSPRWVRYQVEEVKRLCGAKTRAQVIARYKGKT